MYIKNKEINFSRSELLLNQFLLVNSLANIACEWRDSIGRTPFARERYEKYLRSFRRHMFYLNELTENKLLDFVPRGEEEKLLEEFLSSIGYPMDYDVSLNMFRELKRGA